MNCKRVVLLAFLTAVLCAGQARALLLATDWSNTNSNLYSVNVATAAATTIGPTGQTRMIGLVVDADSTIYAISEEADSRLWTLNSTTGAATLVGSLGFNLQEGDMTIDPGTGQMFVADGIGDNLYTVNKATGASSLVGAFGVLGRDVSGLQFFGGTLYGLALRDASIDSLLTIDPSTGTATLVGDTGTNFGVIAAMGRDPVSGKTFIAGPRSAFGTDNLLYEINLTTGVATFVNDLTGMSASVSGFSVAGEPVILKPVPEPGTLILLGSGVLGLIGWRRRTK